MIEDFPSIRSHSDTIMTKESCREKYGRSLCYDDGVGRKSARKGKQEEWSDNDRDSLWAEINNLRGSYSEYFSISQSINNSTSTATRPSDFAGKVAWEQKTGEGSFSRSTENQGIIKGEELRKLGVNDESRFKFYNIQHKVHQRRKTDKRPTKVFADCA